MALTNPTKNWVVRYHASGKPGTQYNFAGWNEDGTPRHTIEFEEIEKFEKTEEAFRVAIELNKNGEYVAEVKRICIALEDAYYFI